MEVSLKRTTASALVLATAVVLTATACSSSKSTSSSTGSSAAALDGKGKTITVWLQSDAQKGWPDVVAQATQRFTAATGAKVNVEWQQWSNYTTKLDSTFAGSTGIPDVVELGNTQTASYIAGGAFKDLSKSDFENSGTWLQGLTESGTSPDGKLEAVPYYAGSRVVIYRKDLWTKAGVTTAPTTLDELSADLDKVKAANASDPNFSAFYMPGKYWYAAMCFVYGAGGTIATSRAASGPARSRARPPRRDWRSGRSWRRRIRSAARRRTSPTRTRSWRRGTPERSSATAGRSAR